MTAKILTFRLKSRPKRSQAIIWLSMNRIEFPKSLKEKIWDDLFYGWRFIRATDGVTYFADCIHPGITEDDVIQFRTLHNNAK